MQDNVKKKKKTGVDLVLFYRLVTRLGLFLLVFEISFWESKAFPDRILFSWARDIAPNTAAAALCE